MARILLILAAATRAFVFDDRSDTSLLEPRDKKILDPVLEDREDIDYYEGSDCEFVRRCWLDGYVEPFFCFYRFIFSYRWRGQSMGNCYVARL